MLAGLAKRGEEYQFENESCPLLHQEIDDEGEAMAAYPTEAEADTKTTYSPDVEILSGNNDSSRMARWGQFVLRLIRLLFPSPVFINFFLAALPQLIPLFYIGQMPDQSSLALAGQFTFISIVLEVIQEGIVNSLFHYAGNEYKENPDLSRSRLKLCLILLIISGCILSAALLAFTGEFVSIIDTPQDIIQKTKEYLWISSFAFPMILASSGITSFLYITTTPLIILAQFCQVVVSFLLNYLLFGQNAWSLQWGVDELGYYKLLESGLNLLVNLVFLHWVERMGLKNFWWDISVRKNLSANFFALFSISWGNFGDSAVRNFFYFVVTLKFINSMGTTEVGAWNLLNTIIYGIFLIPTNSVANVVKVLVGRGTDEDNPSMRRVISIVSKKAFLCLTAWMVIVTCLGYLFWKDVAAYFNPSNEEVQKMSRTMFNHLVVFYVIYSYNTVMDSVFYGTGETSYVFYQSLATNCIVYLTPWILYETGRLQPTYWIVVGLFMAGLVIDFGFTLFFSIRLWRRIPN